MRQKAFLMGYSMRLELTLVSRKKGPLLGQTGLYKGRFSSFLECVCFGLIYPALIFSILYIYIYIYIYVYIYINAYDVYIRVKLVTLVEVDPKAPFSKGTTPMCRGGHYSIS